jgi:hypothetical protein
MPGGDRARYVDHWQRLYNRGLSVIDLAGGHYDMVEAPDAVSAIASALGGRNTIGTSAQRKIAAPRITVAR